MNVDELERELGDRIRLTLHDQIPRLESDLGGRAQPDDERSDPATATHRDTLGEGPASVPVIRGDAGTTRDRRLVRWVAVGVAAAGIAAVAGVVASRDTSSSIQPSAPPADISDPSTVMEDWPNAFDELLTSALPDGFIAVQSNVAPLHAVAYNDDGVRIEVFIDVDSASLPENGRSSIVTSPDGDWIHGSVIYDYDVIGLKTEAVPYDDAPASFLNAQAALPGIVESLADRFTGETRSEILTSSYPSIDSSELRTTIDAAAQNRFGNQLSNRTLTAADFAFTYNRGDVGYTIAVIRTPHRLPDGVTQPSPITTTGRAWRNGWQLIITSTATDRDAAIDTTTMSEHLDAFAPLLDTWQPPTASCSQHTMTPGESLAEIAERYGTTLNGLQAVSPDFEVNTWPGTVIKLPC